MKILFVSNHRTERCGVAEFGRQNVRALQELGHEVISWTPTPDDHAWPVTASQYDVVHVNYHPGTINYLRYPSNVRIQKLSAFWHEPGTESHFGDPDVAFAAELKEGWGEAAEFWLLPMPVPDYTPSRMSLQHPHISSRGKIIAGTSTLRGGGVEEVRGVLDEFGIPFASTAPNWLDTDREIDRLASYDFLVYWYGGANRGQSAAVNMGIAAQRPIILNRNRMFDSLEIYSHELYFTDNLNATVKEVLRDLYHGVAKIPREVRVARLWSRAAATMVDVWKGQR